MRTKNAESQLTEAKDQAHHAQIPPLKGICDEGCHLSLSHQYQGEDGRYLHTLIEQEHPFPLEKEALCMIKEGAWL